MRFRLAPRSMTLDDLELENNINYFPVLGVNISQTVRTTVVRLPLRQLGFLVRNGNVCEFSDRRGSSSCDDAPTMNTRSM